MADERLDCTCDQLDGRAHRRTPTCPPALECLQHDEGGCEGTVEYRMALSPTGRHFPRCEKHWAERLDEQERINQRYPELQPADFDPTYAGERWDDEY